MGKKIARGAGVFFCVLLFVLCVFMIIISAVFGSAGLVGAFGYNLFLCRESSFEGLNSGAAVIVEQCEPYDITEGNLILYSAAGVDEDIIPALGYTEDIVMTDGVYSIDITDNDGKLVTISESAFIGKAGWSSDILGGIISFSRTPWGICVMAVLPCLALIIFSFIRTAMDNAPLPEVVPQVKNSEKDRLPAQPGISVKPDGKAEYSRASGARTTKSADSVLFTYGAAGARKGNPVSKPAPRQSAPAARPEQKRPAPEVKPEIKKPATEQKKPSPAAMKQDAPSTAVPSSVAARNYLDNAVKPAARTSDATAEIPQLPKKPKSDAFFTQSEAPQIGRSINRRNSPARAVIDLEDALATANERRDIVSSAVGASRKSGTDTTQIRSADILAAKNRDQLITEDDDSRDRSRYDVDDILAGMDRRRK